MQYPVSCVEATILTEKRGFDKVKCKILIRFMTMGMMNGGIFLNNKGR